MLSNSHRCELPSEQQHYLLELARLSIRHGLEHDQPLQVELATLPQALQEPRATFVTLKKEGQLRGCIGCLQACRPLARDVAINAFSAAFHDPRFSPVTADETDRLEIHLSLLTPPEPLVYTSEADLLAKLRPGEDGVILEEGTMRGTFLPSVWEELKNPVEFLAHLKCKAGLHANYWSETLKVYRYQAELID